MSACIFFVSWALTFLDFLLSLYPLYQSNGEENHVKCKLLFQYIIHKKIKVTTERLAE